METTVKEFIDVSQIIEISEKIIELCIQIRRKYKIKLPDAIIAATALSNNLVLITNNENDFKKIEGLKFINPFKMQS